MLKRWFRGSTERTLWNVNVQSCLRPSREAWRRRNVVGTILFAASHPRSNRLINVAFDSELRVLHCDNGVCRMAVTICSWLYSGLRPESPFLLGFKVQSYTRINSWGPRLSPDDLDLSVLERKKASLSHQLHLYSNGHFYDAVTNKKHKSGSIPHSLHWGYLDPNYPLRRSLKGFWKFWIRGKGSDERRKWVLPAMSGKWILPVFDCRFGYHWGIVIFFFKHPRLSTAAKLRILTNEKIINSLLTLKSKSHGISRFFYWTEGVYILLCRVAI